MKYVEPKEKPDKEQVEIEFEVRCTRKYDSFKIVQANRIVDTSHVKALAESIKKKNMLAINPVLVSDDMEVIDGQHRIEACRLLGEKVWYVKASGLDHFDIIALNNVKKKWVDMDFFNFFLIKKYNGFKEVNEIMTKYKLSLKDSLMLCSADGKARTREIKSGQIQIGDLSRIDEIMAVYNSIRKVWWNVGSSFLTALRKMMCGDVKLNKQDGGEIEFEGKLIAAFIITNSLSLEDLQEEFKFKFVDPSFLVISESYWTVFLGRLNDALLNGFASEIGLFGCEGYLNNKKLTLEKIE